MSQAFRKELQTLTENEIYRRITEEPDMIEEILHSFGIRMAPAGLGPDIEGMVQRYKGWFYILGNPILETEEQRRTFIHELFHIIREGHCSYLTRIEDDAEEYAADMVAEVAVGWDQQRRVKDNDDEWGI